MVGCLYFADSCLLLVFSGGKALTGLKGTKGRGQVSREESHSTGRGRAGYELGLGAGRAVSESLSGGEGARSLALVWVSSQMKLMITLKP